MTKESSLRIVPLTPEHAGILSELFLGDPEEYREHFIPFSFEEPELEKRLISAKRDRYWGIFVEDSLAAFFMLRGFDEGFERPSFGVYVSKHHAGKGLAGLALHYAVSWCNVQKISSVMLKVHPDNASARRVYERAGFVFESICEDTGHHILVLALRSQ